MQANNDPKWTDDAAFWNEAWADMDERLDEKQPPSRKAAVVWWRRYGWLLGLLLLAVAVATPVAMGYWSQDENLERKEISPSAPAAPTTATPAVIVDNNTESTNPESKPADQPADETIVASSGLNNPDVSKSSTRAITATTILPQKEAPGPTLTADREHKDIERTSTTLPIAAAAPVNEPGISVLKMPATDPMANEVPSALTSLTDLPIGTIEFSKKLGTDQLAVGITKPKLASHLFLDAGISNGLQVTNFGYYAGLQYALPISKRFSIPVGLRFQKNFYNFKKLAGSDTPASFLEAADVSTTASIPDTFFVTFSEDNIDEIVTTALESHIGLSYSPAPRWQIGTSVSLSYLITAKARISSQYQAEFAADQSNRSILNADISLVNGLNFFGEDASFSAVGSPIATGTGSPSGFPQFNQLVAQAGLNISYDFTQKLTLTMAGRRVLAQPDQSKVIGLQRGQLEIGARWRLK